MKESVNCSLGTTGRAVKTREHLHRALGHKKGLGRIYHIIKDSCRYNHGRNYPNPISSGNWARTLLVDVGQMVKHSGRDGACRYKENDCKIQNDTYH